MTERERKMMAFLAGIICDLVNGNFITDNEYQQLINIRDELGYCDLDEKEFRY